MDKPSILIIDEDPDLSDILSKRFIASGWEAKNAKNFEQSEKELEKTEFDVILVDPETELEATVFLRKLQKNKNAKQALKIIHTTPADRTALHDLEKTNADVLWIKGTLSLNDVVKKTKTFLEQTKK